MNYKEAILHSVKVKWKVGVCIQGEKCWCRTIVPETPIENSDDEDIYIVGQGMTTKEQAEHIVKLHNDIIENQSK